MSDGRHRALCEKLVAEAQAALAAGDHEQARELAWKALGCGQDAEEAPGLQQLLEALEAPCEAVGPDEDKLAEPSRDACDTAGSALSRAVTSERRPTVTQQLLSDDEVEAFEAFLGRGGAAGLEAELARECPVDAVSPTSTRRRERDAEPFDQEEQRRERASRLAKLVFGSVAGCVVLTTGWVVVDSVAQAPSSQVECASEGLAPAIAMPSLGGAGALTPRNVPMKEIDRVLAQQRIKDARQESRSRHDAALAIEQRGGAESGARVGSGDLAHARGSERVGSMVPNYGTDAAPVFAKPLPADRAGTPSPQTGRPEVAGRRASRPGREGARAPRRHSGGGGRFFATDMTSRVKSVHVAKQTPRLRLPVGKEIKAMTNRRSAVSINWGR